MSEEFKEYCNKYADLIFIRAKINNKWQSVALSELDVKAIQKQIKDWWDNNHMPVRLKTEEEKKIDIEVDNLLIGANIQHNNICGCCGKIATINYQLVWVKWDIDGAGNFSNQDFMNVDTNEWYCDRCYAKEIDMWNEGDLDREFPL